LQVKSEIGLVVIMTGQELERMDSIALAVLCKNTAKNPSISPLVAEQAHALKLKWVALFLKITPPLLDVRAEEAVQAAIEQVRIRMVDLLVAISDAEYNIDPVARKRIDEGEV
jgi:hypothetical protein